MGERGAQNAAAGAAPEEAPQRVLEAAAAANDAGLRAWQGGDLESAANAFQRAAAALDRAEAVLPRSATEHNLALVRMRQGHLDEAARLLERAVAVAGDGTAERDLHEAAVRLTLGQVARRRDQLDDAAGHYRRALNLYRRHGRTGDVVDVQINLAVLDERAGRLTAAWNRLEAARSAADDADERLSWAAATTTMSAVAAQRGDFATASVLLDGARAVYENDGLPKELADVLTNQGYVHLHVGDYPQARWCLRQALALFTQMGMDLDRARLQGGLASLDRRMGDLHAAADGYAQALHTYRDRGAAREAAGTLVNLGVVACDAERWDQAVDFLQEAEQLYARLGSLLGRATVAHNFGVAAAGRGDWQRAEDYYRQAQSLYRKAEQPRQAAELETNRGIVAAARGNMEAARRHYRRAAAGCRALGLWMPLARCRHNWGLTWPRTSAKRRSMVLPAWLALDATRFTLHRPDERAHWREETGSLAAAAFDVAATDPMLLAELVERARAVGTVDVASAPALGVVARALPWAVTDGPRRSPAPQPEEIIGSLAVRAPAQVHCGWELQLAPYDREAQRLRAVGPNPPPSSDRAVPLGALLRADGRPGR
ncbi:tetratricopeptide repeat protein [Geodermatophilus sp. DF01-2]|uniref:tetratricopeptide repeat protein n=1 Tax=Geodermatophilus sp. DF01-2 TaxID=2559610 RepID=UPI0010749BE0|nr:tetratricopeptide repeat protein [Geodermatophilus sp. DF01_2]TFV53909.1 tetratricopeptide repeat protein [Geodermatophilus sp. DF01_2]